MTDLQTKKTHVVILLDESGSMTQHREAVVESFNEYIKGLTGTPRIKMSLFKFDSAGYGKEAEDILRKSFENIPLEEVREISQKDYTPRGMTPLYDATAKLINHTHERLKDTASELVQKLLKAQQSGEEVSLDQKVLFVVHTDGHENSSKEINSDGMKILISKMEDSFGWTFVYLGEGQDAWGGNVGMGISNASNYVPSMRGTNINKLASVTMAYSTSDRTDSRKTLYQDENIDPDDKEEASTT